MGLNRNETYPNDTEVLLVSTRIHASHAARDLADFRDGLATGRDFDDLETTDRDLALAEKALFAARLAFDAYVAAAVAERAFRRPSSYTPGP